MARTVTYRIVDEPDGRFTVLAVMEPDRAYRRGDFATLAEAEDWVEGLRVLMAACGAPVVTARIGSDRPAPALARDDAPGAGDGRGDRCGDEATGDRPPQRSCTR